MTVYTVVFVQYVYLVLSDTPLRFVEECLKSQHNYKNPLPEGGRGDETRCLF